MNDYRFCPRCAAPLDLALRGGRERPACPRCGFVHYRNPSVGVAVVILRDGQILLGRRSAGSSYAGQWCIPCGHVEWDEDVRETAARELAEETGLLVEIGDVLSVHSNTHNPVQHTVGIWFRGAVVGGSLRAGDDLEAVAYFELDAPPEPLAFPTDRLVLDQLAREQASRVRCTA